MSKKAGKARKAVKKLHRRTSPRLAAPAPKPTKTSTAALLSALPLAPAVPSAASDDVKTEAATLPARQALAQGTTAPVPHESVSENVAAAVQMRTKPAEAAPEAGVEEAETPAQMSAASESAPSGASIAKFADKPPIDPNPVDDTEDRKEREDLESLKDLEMAKTEAAPAEVSDSRASPDAAETIDPSAALQCEKAVSADEPIAESELEQGLKPLEPLEPDVDMAAEATRESDASPILGAESKAIDEVDGERESSAPMAAATPKAQPVTLSETANDAADTTPATEPTAAVEEVPVEAAGPEAAATVEQKAPGVDAVPAAPLEAARDEARAPDAAEGPVEKSPEKADESTVATASEETQRDVSPAVLLPSADTTADATEPSDPSKRPAAALRAASECFLPVRARLRTIVAAFAGISGLAAALLFAAANWAGWPGELRIGFFGLLALVAGGAFLRLKRRDTRRRPSRCASDIAASLFGVALGLLLCVIGQTYQSGADASTLLLAWGALLTPWLFVVRRALFFTLWFAVALGGLLLSGERLLASAGLLEQALPGTLFALAVAFVLALCARRPWTRVRAAAALPSLAAVLLTALLPAVMLMNVLGTRQMLALVPVYVLGFLLLAGALLFSRRGELRSLAVFGAATLLEGFWLHWSADRLANSLVAGTGLLIALAALFVLYRIGRQAARQVSAEEALHSSRLSLVPATAAALLSALALVLALELVQSVLDLPALETGLATALAALALEAAGALRSRGRLASRGAASLSREGVPLPHAQAVLGHLRAPASIAWAILAAAGIALVFTEAVFGPGDLTAAVIASTLSLAAAALFRSRFALFAAMALFVMAVPERTAVVTGAAALAAGVLTVFVRCASTGAMRLRFAAARALPAFIWMSWFGASVMPWCFDVPVATFASAEGAALAGAVLVAVAASGLSIVRAGFDKLFALGLALLSALLLWRFGPDAAALALALSALVPVPEKREVPQAAERSSANAETLERRTLALSPLHFLFLFWSSAHAAYWLLPSEAGSNLLLAAALDQLFVCVLFGILFALERFSPAGRKDRAAPAAVRVRSIEDDDARTSPRLGTLKRVDLAASALLLLLTVLVFALGVLKNEQMLDGGTVYEAALAPADPRDILMGDYMALRYKALENAPDAKTLADAFAEKAEGTLGETPSAEGPARFVAAFGLDANTAQTRTLKLLGIVAAGAELPSGTTLVVAYDPTTKRAQLPERWFFSSGEAERWSHARTARLRCTPTECLLESLLDEEGRVIESDSDFWSRFFNAHVAR